MRNQRRKLNLWSKKRSLEVICNNESQEEIQQKSTNSVWKLNKKTQKLKNILFGYKMLVKDK